MKINDAEIYTIEVHNYCQNGCYELESIAHNFAEVVEKIRMLSKDAIVRKWVGTAVVQTWTYDEIWGNYINNQSAK